MQIILIKSVLKIYHIYFFQVLSYINFFFNLANQFNNSCFYREGFVRYFFSHFTSYLFSKMLCISFKRIHDFVLKISPQYLMDVFFSLQLVAVLSLASGIDHPDLRRIFFETLKKIKAEQNHAKEKPQISPELIEDLETMISLIKKNSVLKFFF